VAEVLVSQKFLESEKEAVQTLEDKMNIVYGPREASAYVAVRFPRVYGAISHIFEEVLYCH